MNQQQINRFLSWLSAVLVLALAVGGFALSYDALKSVAQLNGYDGWRAYIWPLLVDAALVVFSIAIVRAYVWRESNLWPWSLVGVFTLLTIVFNLVHAGQSTGNLNLIFVSIPLRYPVAIVPPIALVLAFETLMSMLKSGVQRHGLLESGQELRQKLQTLRQTIETEQDKHNKVVDNLINKKVVIETELTKLQDRIETKRKELTDIGQQSVVIIGDTDPVKMGPSERQPYIAQMIKQDIDEDIILRTFGISAKTLSRDKAALNGQLK